jgi:hypothetical protein
VDSYEYPANLQIPTDIKRNSIEGKTMLKAKEVVKDNKEFTAKEPAPSKESNPSTDVAPKYQTGFAPLPQPVGSKDNEWTYLGRFIGRGQNNISYVEYAMLMVPFNSPKECDGVFDVYYYHKHTVDFGANNDNGGYCRVDQYGGHWGYSCILKLVPLDKNGNRIQRKGVCTELIHIGGASKGEYGYGVSKVFRYDTLTHELVETITEDKPGSRKLNLERHETIYQKYGYNLNTNYSPYWLAAKYSHCPQNWTDRT